MARIGRLSLAAEALLLAIQCPISIASRVQQPIIGAGAGARDHSTPGNPFTDEIGEYITDLLEEWKVPGVSIAVVDGQEVHAKGYGFAILPDTPATPETLWHGGSTTKAFVDAALAHLISNGSYHVLDGGWSTPISSIIRDDFVLQDEWSTSHVTLEDAASHRTGMPRHDLSWARLKDGKRVSNQDIVRNLRNLSPTAPPRVIWQYCNLMYITLGYVIETVTGEGLKDALRDVIWGPLGMTSTYLDRQEAEDRGEPLAQGYVWDPKTKQYSPVSDTVRESSGAGGIVSNVLDYSKWLRCLLHQTAPFSNSTHAEIRKPRMIQVTEPSRGNDVELYGLGWGRTVLHGQVVYSHNGGTGAFGTDVYWLPDLQYAVAMFGNTAGSSNSVEALVIRKLIEDKLKIPADERVDLSSGLKKQVEDHRYKLDHAAEILYPNLPKPTLPPSKKPSSLVGTYVDAGYGTLHIKEAVDPEDASSTVLVGDRGDMIMPFDFVLRHTSGDYWIMYLGSSKAPRELGDAVAAKFSFGADGEASGLEVTWDQARPGLKEVKVLFNKEE